LKYQILMFFKTKNLTCYRCSKACAHHLDFQYNNFLYPFSIVKKRPLYVNSNIPPCGKYIYFQYSTPLVGIDMYLTHLRTRIKCCTIHAYLKKLFFWPSKLCCLLLAHGKKTFLSTLTPKHLRPFFGPFLKFGQAIVDAILVQKISNFW
jgi:hypothetical protein